MLTNAFNEEEPKNQQLLFKIYKSRVIVGAICLLQGIETGFPFVNFWFLFLLSCASS